MHGSRNISWYFLFFFFFNFTVSVKIIVIHRNFTSSRFSHSIFKSLNETLYPPQNVAMGNYVVKIICVLKKLKIKPESKANSKYLYGVPCKQIQMINPALNSTRHAGHTAGLAPLMRMTSQPSDRELKPSFNNNRETIKLPHKIVLKEEAKNCKCHNLSLKVTRFHFKQTTVVFVPLSSTCQ